MSDASCTMVGVTSQWFDPEFQKQAAEWKEEHRKRGEAMANSISETFRQKSVAESHDKALARREWEESKLEREAWAEERERAARAREEAKAIADADRAKTVQEAEKNDRRWRITTSISVIVGLIALAGLVVAISSLIVK